VTFLARQSTDVAIILEGHLPLNLAHRKMTCLYFVKYFHDFSLSAMCAGEEACFGLLLTLSALRLQRNYWPTLNTISKHLIHKDNRFIE
jgi:hypothetical protein